MSGCENQYGAPKNGVNSIRRCTRGTASVAFPRGVTGFAHAGVPPAPPMKHATRLPLNRCLPLAISVTAMSFLAACDEGSDDGMANDASTGEATDGTTSTSSSSTSGSDTSASDTTAGETVDASAYDCVETEPMIQPLFGNHWDPETESIIGETQATYVVHTTQAYVPAETAQMFADLSYQVVEQLYTTPGLIAVGFMTEPNCGFSRTVGIWTSEQAMYDFVVSGAHANAMAQTASLNLSGRVAHFEVPAEDLPLSWDTIRERIGAIEPFGVY